jgi:hypothetical protein
LRAVSSGVSGTAGAEGSAPAGGGLPVPGSVDGPVIPDPVIGAPGVPIGTVEDPGAEGADGSSPCAPARDA